MASLSTFTHPHVVLNSAYFPHTVTKGCQTPKTTMKVVNNSSYDSCTISSESVLFIWGTEVHLRWCYQLKSFLYTVYNEIYSSVTKLYLIHLYVLNTCFCPLYRTWLRLECFMYGKEHSSQKKESCTHLEWHISWQVTLNLWDAVKDSFM